MQPLSPNYSSDPSPPSLPLPSPLPLEAAETEKIAKRHFGGEKERSDETSSGIQACRKLSAGSEPSDADPAILRLQEIRGEAVRHRLAHKSDQYEQAVKTYFYGLNELYLTNPGAACRMLASTPHRFFSSMPFLSWNGMQVSAIFKIYLSHSECFPQTFASSLTWLLKCGDAFYLSSKKIGVVVRWLQQIDIFNSAHGLDFDILQNLFSLPYFPQIWEEVLVPASFKFPDKLLCIYRMVVLDWPDLRLPANFEFQEQAHPPSYRDRLIAALRSPGQFKLDDFLSIERVLAALHPESRENFGEVWKDWNVDDPRERYAMSLWFLLHGDFIFNAVLERENLEELMDSLLLVKEWGRKQSCDEFYDVLIKAFPIIAKNIKEEVYSDLFIHKFQRLLKEALYDVSGQVENELRLYKKPPYHHAIRLVLSLGEIARKSPCLFAKLAYPLQHVFSQVTEMSQSIDYQPQLNQAITCLQSLFPLIKPRPKIL